MTESLARGRVSQAARATQFIADVISGIDAPETSSWTVSERNWVYLLKRASQNRVLYLFARNLAEMPTAQHPPALLERLQKITTQGEIRLRRLGDTLEFVTSELEQHKVPYLVIKTDKYIPYVTFDVDLLVREEDFDAVQRLFSAKGVEILPHSSLLGRKPGKQMNCLKPGLLNIDLHTEITWQGSDYIEPVLFWQNTRRLTRHGVTFDVPSLEVEFMVDCAEVLYERFYFHLLHLLSLRKFCRQSMDWELIFEHTRRYGWQNAFANLLVLLEGTSARLLKGEPFTLPLEVRDRAQQLTGRKTLPAVDVLPHLFSPARVVTIFWERIRRRRHFDPVCFSYWLYTRLRYVATRGRRFPLYLDWIPLGDRFYWRKPC